MNKVFAVAATVGLLGATMVGALADLGNYPAPFIEDGVFNGGIVVGANAATQDVLGAIDIAASLQAEAKTGVAIAGGAVAVEGGEALDTFALNEEITATLTESDIEGLLDTSIRWNSNDYDVSEAIAVGGLHVATFNPDDGLGEEEFGSDPYLTVQTAGQIQYHYVFGEDIRPADAAELESRPIEIRMLDKTLKISKITNDTTDSIQVEASSETFMEEGDTVEVDGKTIQLRKVGTNSVLVTVDGETKAVSEDNSPVEFEGADYFKVELVSMFYIEGATDNSATLKLGDDLLMTVEDGDPMTMFGEPDDEFEAEWLWIVNVATDNEFTAGDIIGAEQSIARTKVDIEDADEERPALAMGEALEFPNNYVSIEFVGYEDAAQNEYDDLTIKPVNTRFEGTYRDAMELSTTADKASFYVYNATDDLVAKVDRVYVADDNIVYDEEKEEILATYVGATIALRLDSVEVDIVPVAGAWTITAGTDNFTLDIPASMDRFGAVADEAEAGEVDFNTVNIGENDETFRTTYGIVVQDMESQMDSDEFSITIPHEQKMPVVVVSGKGTSVGVSESGMSYNVNPIALGLGMLDIDANLGSKPMIVVGGPVVNTAAAELMGNPTPDELAATFSPGKAIIRWYEDQQAMLVVGYEAMETQGASYVVARHQNYDFEGEELEVVVTSLNNIVVNSI